MKKIKENTPPAPHQEETFHFMSPIQQAELISPLGHGLLFRKMVETCQAVFSLYITRNPELYKSNNITCMDGTSISEYSTGNEYPCKTVLVICQVNLNEQYGLLHSFKKKYECLSRQIMMKITILIMITTHVY